MPQKPHCPRLMWKKLFWGHLKKQMNHCISFFPTCGPVHNNISSICYYFGISFFLPVSGPHGLISCLPLMKWVLHKPIQTRAMAAATKIIYSENTQWSDTSISSPAGDRENRGGHYKDHIAGKVRSIFYPTLISQTRPFSPGALPFSAPLKIEACFPSINRCTRSFATEGCSIMQQFPFQHVLVHKFVHFVCEKWMWIHKWVHSLLPNHWQMCNSFPVILLP